MSVEANLYKIILSMAEQMDALEHLAMTVGRVERENADLRKLQLEDDETDIVFALHTDRNDLSNRAADIIERLRADNLLLRQQLREHGKND